MANFRQMGFIVGDRDTEVSVAIPGFATPRKYDFVALDSESGQLVGVEVKSTRFDAINLNIDQVEKDVAVYYSGGIFLPQYNAVLTSVAYDMACDGCQYLNVRSVYLHLRLMALGVNFHTRRYIDGREQ